VEFSSSHPHFVAETDEHALFARAVEQQELHDAWLIRKSDGGVQAAASLPVGAQLEASADLTVIVATQYATTSDDPVAWSSHVWQLNAAGNAYDLTAEYSFAASEYSNPVKLLVTSAGAYQGVRGNDGSYRLQFLPAMQATGVVDVLPGNTAYIEPLWLSGRPFARIGQLYHELSEDGSLVRTLGPANRILTVNDESFIAVERAATTNLYAQSTVTDSVEILATIPSSAAFSIIDEPDGPGQFSVIGVAHDDRNLLVVTDATHAGTRTIPLDLNPVPYRAPRGVHDRAAGLVFVTVDGYSLRKVVLSSGEVEALGDVNAFGGDAIAELRVVGNVVWFTAQADDGSRVIARVDGNEIRQEAAFEASSSIRLTELQGRAAAVMGSGSVAAGARAGIYEIDETLADPSPGPRQLEAAIQPDALHAHWLADPQADFYEVRLRAWFENGDHVSNWRTTQFYTTVNSPEFVLPLEADHYGWNVLHVRSVKYTGESSQWTTLTFSQQEQVQLPGGLVPFQREGEWHLAAKEYPGYLGVRDILWSHQSEADPIVSGSAWFQYRYDDALNPFKDQIDFWDMDLYLPGDGDFTFRFWSEYIDADPVTRDNSLPLVSSEFVLSQQDGQIVQFPTWLQSQVDSQQASLGWNGTALPGEPGFQIWVDDIGRGRPRVVLKEVRGHQEPLRLPNGDYRAWVGRQNADTGRMNWSPPAEFQIAVPPDVLEPTVVTDRSRPTFRWTGNPVGRFEVWLNYLDTGQRIVRQTVTGTSWTPDADLDRGRYAFWVRELLPGGSETGWSDVAGFRKLAPSVRIIDGLEPGVDQTPTLSWENAAGAVSYEIWISRKGAVQPIYRMAGVSATSHRVDTPIGNGGFTVWVRAHFADGSASAWGAGQGMTIGEPVRLSHEGSQLTWLPIVNATHYELWIDYAGGEQPRQPKIIHEPLLTNTHFTLPNSLPRGRYTAWVRAIRAESGEVYRSHWSSAVEIEITNIHGDAGGENGETELTVLRRSDELPDSRTPARLMQPADDPSAFVASDGNAPENYVSAQSMELPQLAEPAVESVMAEVAVRGLPGL